MQQEWQSLQHHEATWHLPRLTSPLQQLSNFRYLKYMISVLVLHLHHQLQSFSQLTELIQHMHTAHTVDRSASASTPRSYATLELGRTWHPDVCQHSSPYRTLFIPGRQETRFLEILFDKHLRRESFHPAAHVRVYARLPPKSPSSTPLHIDRSSSTYRFFPKWRPLATPLFRASFKSYTLHRPSLSSRRLSRVASAQKFSSTTHLTNFRAASIPALSRLCSSELHQPVLHLSYNHPRPFRFTTTPLC